MKRSEEDLDCWAVSHLFKGRSGKCHWLVNWLFNEEGDH